MIVARLPIPHTADDDFKEACHHYSVGYTCVGENIDHDQYELQSPDLMTLVYLGHMWGLNSAQRIADNLNTIK